MCSDFKILHSLLSEPEKTLKSLFFFYSNEFWRILNRIRKYNFCFLMTSFGVDNEVVVSVISFTSQGQIYYIYQILLFTTYI